MVPPGGLGLRLGALRRSAASRGPGRTAGVIALAALAGTASYLFYYKAIGTIGASRGMALNISYSAWAVVFALILLRTVPSPLQVGCCVVILTGTVLAATPRWEDLRPLRGRRRAGVDGGLGASPDGDGGVTAA